MDPTLRALNRFGLGARLGERGRTPEARAWLRGQLDGTPAPLAAPAGASRTEIGAALRGLRQLGAGNDRERQEARRRLVQIGVAESRAALTMRVTTEQPFLERLVAFWSNHLCVSVAAKVTVAPQAGAYEREVIRPHVLGRFEDMVLASAQHPAMLFYLDNVQSIGPNSPGARFSRRRNMQRGLNENYARELLELHTLGVDGGYTQQDIIEMARILTGWTINQATYEFEFREELHEPGDRRVLGVQYRDGGEETGRQVIRALCRHPATARFVAAKLVRHFVSDDPPAADVARIARVFQETDGDLREVSRVLIDLPGAWADDTKKFRTPQEWLIALLRAFDVRTVNDMTMPLLRQLRHPLWAPQSPKGFGDTMSEWADPDSLLNRAELARTLAGRFMRDADPRALIGVVDVAPADPLHALLSDTSIPAHERIALALAGPAFQWR